VERAMEARPARDGLVGVGHQVVEHEGIDAAPAAVDEPVRVVVRLTLRSADMLASRAIVTCAING